MKNNLIIWLFLAFLLCTITKNINADILYLDLNTLIKYSYEIVEGKVTKVETRWDDEHRLIYTFTTVKISKAYKDRIKEKEITLKEIGGTVGDYSTYALYQPEFEENENILIFLKKDEMNYYRTLPGLL